MKSDHNPYQPAQATEQGDERKPPVWRLFLGSLLRMSGGIVITVPLVMIAFDLFGSGLDDYLSDFPAIATALFCYIVLGSLLIYTGNKLSPCRH